MKSFLVLAMLFVSCGTSQRKIFIKSINIDNSKRVDWYFHSLTNNFTRSYIQIADNNHDNVEILESFFISDINLYKDTLKIQVYENNYTVDSAILPRIGLKIVVDTLGKVWNQASSRLGRLQKKNVDFFKPHFEDSFCPNNECN